MFGAKKVQFAHNHDNTKTEPPLTILTDFFTFIASGTLYLLHIYYHDYGEHQDYYMPSTVFHNFIFFSYSTFP